MSQRNRKETLNVPSLLELCVQTAIDNVRYLGDVGGIDTQLLERILPHCSADQLKHIEDSSEVRESSTRVNFFEQEVLVAFNVFFWFSFAGNRP